MTEPVTVANVDPAMSEPDLSNSKHAVVQTEDEVDLQKRVVPEGRVPGKTATVTDEVAVDEAIRKERMAYEGDDRGARGRQASAVVPVSSRWRRYVAPAAVGSVLLAGGIASVVSTQPKAVDATEGSSAATQATTVAATPWPPQSTAASAVETSPPSSDIKVGAAALIDAGAAAEPVVAHTEPVVAAADRVVADSEPVVAESSASTATDSTNGPSGKAWEPSSPAPEETRPPLPPATSASPARPAPVATPPVPTAPPVPAHPVFSAPPTPPAAPSIPAATIRPRAAPDPAGLQTTTTKQPKKTRTASPTDSEHPDRGERQRADARDGQRAGKG
jgi:hypothetical protein